MRPVKTKTEFFAFAGLLLVAYLVTTRVLLLGDPAAALVTIVAAIAAYSLLGALVSRRR